MRLISVNVGLPKEIPHKGGAMRTGIVKEPIPGRVMVRKTNIDGDGQAHRKVHGGEDQAVYAYPFEHYGHWKRILGRKDLPFGIFGENLTIEGMLEEDVRRGDRLRIGDAVLEVTRPRIPCAILSTRVGGEDFHRLFMASGRTGFYLRVQQEGTIGVGDTIERIPGTTSEPTIRMMWEEERRRA